MITIRTHKPVPLTGVRKVTSAGGGLDGLVSVLRFFSEPSSPQRSFQPALIAYETSPEPTNGSRGTFLKYRGISTTLPDTRTFHCIAKKARSQQSHTRITWLQLPTRPRQVAGGA